MRSKYFASKAAKYSLKDYFSLPALENFVETNDRNRSVRKSFLFENAGGFELNNFSEGGGSATSLILGISR